MKKENRLIINKAFFGKSNCLKVTLNKNKECYMHWGVEKDKKYQWIKAKFNTDELGKIVRVFDGKLKTIALYHKFDEKVTQFWINRKEDVVLLRAKSGDLDISKSISDGEQEVLSILLRNIIIRMCIV